MKQYYKVYASEHNIIDVQADKFDLDENTLELFKIKIWDSGIRKLDICSKCARKIRKICKAESEDET